MTKTFKSQLDLWESQFAGTHTEVLAQETQDFIAAVDDLMEKVKSLEAKIKQDGGHVD